MALRGGGKIGSEREKEEDGEPKPLKMESAFAKCDETESHLVETLSTERR